MLKELSKYTLDKNINNKKNSMNKKSTKTTDTTNSVLKLEAEPVKISTEVAIEVGDLTSPTSEFSSEMKVSETEKSKKTSKSASKSPKSTKADLEEVSDVEETGKVNLPTFPDVCYENIPSILSRAVAKGSTPEDKDILLLGSIVTLSACLPNVSGTYDQREVYPNLFLFVTAKASAGKGRLTLCRELVSPIHKVLVDKQKQEMIEYKSAVQLFKATSGRSSDLGSPQEPPLRALIIPANSSATSMFQILNDNEGIGLMFETEGDTLAQAFKSEHGNYSDGFRKAFHHETISYSRRKDKEFVELDKPRLSAVLSGTPSQVARLIPSAENGLFSRFIYYYMNIRPEWNDVFAGDGEQSLDAYYALLGKEFHALYNLLRVVKPMTFRISPKQQDEFNHYFTDMQTKLHCILGDEYLASVRRLGLITYRIAMILTTLRMLDNCKTSETLVCSDTDFKTAMSMVNVLIEHASYVFSQLPVERMHVGKGKSNKQLFLDALPKEFNRQGYLDVAIKLGIEDKTAQKYIGEFKKTGWINHEGHNKYSKQLTISPLAHISELKGNFKTKT